MKQEIYIDGTRIKTPTNFSISRFNLTKSGRVSSGKMTMELVAKKRKFFFEYASISSVDLNVILSLIDSDAMFFELSYVENNEVKTATVYGGEIPSKLHRTGGVWFWTDVNFDLIEQ